MNTPHLYLNCLKLTNFATFKRYDIEFCPGLNTIVGETGSGKSLILDALQLVFGGRSDKKIVRRDTDYTVIEASLLCQDPETHQFLDQLGFPQDGDEIVLKRIIYKNGTSKSFINHQSCSLSLVGQFAKQFIDLVGQFENQRLLSDQYQLQLLDQFVGNQELLETFKQSLATLKVLRLQERQFEASLNERDQRLDYLDYQLQEIAKLSPQLNEEEELIQKKNDFMNFEKKSQIFQQMISLWENDTGNGINHLLRYAQSLTSKNTGIIPSQLNDKVATLNQLSSDLYVEFSRLNDQDLNPEELNSVLERLDLYQKLKRKLGGSVEQILESQERFQKEFEQLKNHETDFSKLKQDILIQEKETYALAEKLHIKREKSAIKLSDALTTAVQSLKMNGADIVIKTEKALELTDSGLTKIHFLAQTNPGEGYFKVKEIASGGELSRILLGLRQVLSAHDSISIFLFDEIDTGMGGETALHIGKSLKNVSSSSQVITITHLPQIASFADRLIVVSKEIEKDPKNPRTESFIKIFEGKELKKEVDNMIPLLEKH